jgi:hypothetical protein
MHTNRYRRAPATLTEDPSPESPHTPAVWREITRRFVIARVSSAGDQRRDQLPLARRAHVHAERTGALIGGVR